MDDAALVGAARDGDRQAFAALYDRYADPVHDFATSMLRDRHEAADVLQETFLTAALQLANLRDPSKVRAWLFAIARNDATGRLRARQRTVPTDETGDAPATEEPVATRPLDESQAQALVWEAAAGLAERDRTVLDLHVRHGLAGQELGDALGVSEGHAAVLLHRVRDRFERAVGALLVARSGRAECAALDAVLEGWDGRYSALIRKRVARHVEACDECSEHKRRLVSPLAALAAVPAIPAPAAARDYVLERAELVAHQRTPPLGGPGGFPPRPRWPSRLRRPGRPSKRSAVAALVVLLLVAGVTLRTAVDRDGVDLVAVSTGDSGDSGNRSSSDGAGASTTTATSGEGASSGSNEGRSTAGGTTTGGSGGGGGGTDRGDGGSSDGGEDGGGSTASGTEAHSTTTTGARGSGGSDEATTTTTTTTSGSSGGGGASTTTTTAGDTTGPAIGVLSSNEPDIWEDSVVGCQPTTGTVSVTVTDASGLDTVELKWSVGNASGSTSMSATGSTWSAAVGGFGESTLDSGSAPVTLTVTAQDHAGNTSTRSTTSALTLNDCSFG